MSDVMTFPKTVDEFMEEYKVIDTEHVYSNGTEYVPIYRMKQWFEAHKSIPIEWIKKFIDNVDGNFLYPEIIEFALQDMIDEWEKENDKERSNK